MFKKICAIFVRKTQFSRAYTNHFNRSRVRQRPLSILVWQQEKNGRAIRIYIRWRNEKTIAEIEENKKLLW